MDKILVKYIYLIISFTIISCGNHTKNNEKQNKVEFKKESKNKIRNDELSLKIGDYLKTKFLNEVDLRTMTKEDRKFQFSTIDLNGDGVNEIFVYLNSVSFCGSGGCTFLLLDNSFNLITKFTVTRTPILVSEKVKNDWNKLYLFSDGYREIIYNKKMGSYPTNPSLEDKMNENLNNQEHIIRLFDSENQPNIYY